MSQLILPNKKAPINIEFNVLVMPNSEMAIQATWAGGMIQLPPVAPEIIAGIAEHLSAAASKVIAQRDQANGSILAFDGQGTKAL